jgi:predicted HicB family RNase H-like nuclease
VEDYLEFCAERGEKPEKPYSGRFVVRLEPDTHQRIHIHATQNGVSLNQWIIQVIVRELERESIRGD